MAEKTGGNGGAARGSVDGDLARAREAVRVAQWMRGPLAVMTREAQRVFGDAGTPSPAGAGDAEALAHLDAFARAVDGKAERVGEVFRAERAADRDAEH